MYFCNLFSVLVFVLFVLFYCLMLFSDSHTLFFTVNRDFSQNIFLDVTDLYFFSICNLFFLLPVCMSLPYVELFNY